MQIECTSQTGCVCFLGRHRGFEVSTSGQNLSQFTPPSFPFKKKNFLRGYKGNCDDHQSAWMTRGSSLWDALWRALPPRCRPNHCVSYRTLGCWAYRPQTYIGDHRTAIWISCLRKLVWWQVRIKIPQRGKFLWLRSVWRSCTSILALILGNILALLQEDFWA